MTATTGTSLVPVADTFVFGEAERLALLAFLAGYRGTTRDAYRMALRLFAAWSTPDDSALFEVRVDVERYARQLESRGLAGATVARRLSTVAGFYRYAEQEGLIDQSPQSLDLSTSCAGAPETLVTPAAPENGDNRPPGTFRK
jgi:site-specific recombinase XerD